MERQKVGMNTKRKRSPKRGRSLLSGRKEKKKNIEKGSVERGGEGKIQQQQIPSVYQEAFTDQTCWELVIDILRTILLIILGIASLTYKITQQAELVLDQYVGGSMDNECQNMRPSLVPAENGSGVSSSSAPTPASAPQPPSPPPPPVTIVEAPVGRRYITPMPYPGSPGAPYFSGHNVTEFVNRFALICRDYGVSEEEMFEKLPWYCEKMIGDYIKSIPEYVERDGAGLFKMMRKDYRKHDLDQQINSRNFLEIFKSKPRTEKDDLKQYCRQFHTISYTLVERGQLEKYTRAMWFIQGLPPKTREKVVRKVGCDTEDAETMDYTKIFKVASAIADTAHILDGFDISREETVELSTLADSYQTKVAPNPTKQYAPPISAPVATDPDGIKSVTKALEALTLSQQVIVNQLGIRRSQPVTGSASTTATRNKIFQLNRLMSALSALSALERGPEICRCR